PAHRTRHQGRGDGGQGVRSWRRRLFVLLRTTARTIGGRRPPRRGRRPRARLAHRAGRAQGWIIRPLPASFERLLISWKSRTRIHSRSARIETAPTSSPITLTTYHA